MNVDEGQARYFKLTALGAFLIGALLDITRLTSSPVCYPNGWSVYFTVVGPGLFVVGAIAAVFARSPRIAGLVVVAGGVHAGLFVLALLRLTGTCAN